MTINVVIHCKDGIALGCDSLGSLVQQMLIPNTGKPLIDKKSGQPIINPNTGQPVIDLATMQMREVVTSSFGFENKLLQIKDYPIGMVISGSSVIGNRTIEDLIYEFSNNHQPYETIKDSFTTATIIDDLRSFLATQYQQAYQSLPGTPLSGPILNLLIGGYSANSLYGEIYQLRLPDNKITPLNSSQNPYSMNVAGQGDAIERFMSGIEIRVMNQLMAYLQNLISDLLKRMEAHTRKFILDFLQNNNIQLPSIPQTPPANFPINIPIQVAQYNIPFNLMTLQDSVDFIVFLSYIVYGRQRFVVGVPTVGGAIHAATITRQDGFRKITNRDIDPKNLIKTLEVP